MLPMLFECPMYTKHVLPSGRLPVRAFPANTRLTESGVFIQLLHKIPGAGLVVAVVPNQFPEGEDFADPEDTSNLVRTHSGHVA